MSFLCLWNPIWQTTPSATPTPISTSTATSPTATSDVAVSALLLTIVPRIVANGDRVWADIRGLPLFITVDRIAQRCQHQRADQPKIGVATTPIAAEVAAQYAPQAVTHVRPGDDRAFLASFRIGVLHPDPTLARFLDGAGIEFCGDLARLSRESVEVRFGAEGVRLWRLARADDMRRIFTTLPQTLPEASFEWTEYTVRRAERLVFIINALCGNVCDTLRSRGLGATMMTLRFSLANRTMFEHSVRAARPTAGQTAWMRLLRLAVEEMTLPDAVTGITLRAESVAGLGDKQGDMFDRGFSTAHAAEEAIAQLLDDQGAVVVVPDNTQHPLLDRRTAWTPLHASQVLEYAPHDPPTPSLILQLLPTPRRIAVMTEDRRDHQVPRRYRDGNDSYRIVEVAGPDRVSGGQWEEGYVREYFRCVNAHGTLVWLYRDVRSGVWYLHGWWD